MLHIIEPTLNSTAGHCFTVVHTLAKANAEHPLTSIEIWADQGMKTSLLDKLVVKVHTHFLRKFRRIQVYFLLRKLLGKNDTVFLPTTSRAELTAFALLPNSIKNKGKVFFYIHQMRMDGTKKKRLQAIAKQAQQAYILCTTEELAQSMREAGFQHVQVQLCPFEIPAKSPQKVDFKHVVFPGIARMDKNFPFVASLVQYLKEKQHQTPCFIQAAPNHHGEFPENILDLIQQIKKTAYSNLNMPCHSLDGYQYLEQFSGAICLQPYLVDEYSNKISGITLDALARGCPIIIQKGIHSAELVEKYQAGISIQGCDEDEWMNAIQEIIEHYDFYQNNCRMAFDFLSDKHHPIHTLETLMQP